MKTLLTIAAILLFASVVCGQERLKVYSFAYYSSNQMVAWGINDGHIHYAEGWNARRAAREIRSSLAADENWSMKITAKKPSDFMRRLERSCAQLVPPLLKREGRDGYEHFYGCEIRRRELQ